MTTDPHIEPTEPVPPLPAVTSESATAPTELPATSTVPPATTSGPRIVTVLAGLALIATAVFSWVYAVAGWQVAWRVSAPTTVVGAGLVLVVLGALGMRNARR